MNTNQIWFKEYSLDYLNNRYGHNEHIGAVLGIEFTEIGDDYIKAKMPVDKRTHQPFGILHGGASVVLAESIGSLASNLCIDQEKYISVGVEVNANHLRPVKSGYVTAICSPIKVGRKIQVWEIKIYNEQNQIVCVSKLTTMTVKRDEI
jgi:1,4-dihydroxy-2-naphthoyl-CoA hydrolase